MYAVVTHRCCHRILGYTRTHSFWTCFFFLRSIEKRNNSKKSTAQNSKFDGNTVAMDRESQKMEAATVASRQQAALLQSNGVKTEDGTAARGSATTVLRLVPPPTVSRLPLASLPPVTASLPLLATAIATANVAPEATAGATKIATTVSAVGETTGTARSNTVTGEIAVVVPGAVGQERTQPK